MNPARALQMHPNSISSGVWTSVRTSALSINSDAWNGYTMRQRVLAAGLTDVVGTQVRLTFEASSGEGLTITKARIGVEGATNFSYAVAPTIITFDGGSASTTISAGTQKVSDAATFSYDGTVVLVVAVYFNGGTGSDQLRYGGITNSKVAYKLADEVATTGALSGYTNWDGGVDRDIIAKWEALV